MHNLTGYVDRWSAKQGKPIRFHISSAGGAPFDLRFVHHTCPDPNPRGPQRGPSNRAIGNLLQRGCRILAACRT